MFLGVSRARFFSAFFCGLALIFCGDPERADASPNQEVAPRSYVSFDRGWKFYLGEAPGAEQPDYVDTTWRPIDLPHDWSIEGAPNPDPKKQNGMEGPFDRLSPAGAAGGYLNGGVGWYRKTFEVPASARGGRVSLVVDGAMRNSHFWLNGTDLGERPYGYSSFIYELTPYLRFNQPNELAVRLEVTQPNSRFYCGAGLYRNCWLLTTGQVHFTPWTTFISTPNLSDTKAIVRVQTQIVNQQNQPARATVHTVIYDPQGIRVAETSSAIDSPMITGSTRNIDQTLVVAAPQRWAPAHPLLYRVVTELRAYHAATNIPAELIDRVVTPIGLRTIEFTRDHGFLLNGQPCAIQGVCDHSDLGCLGMAAYRRAIERQVEILKASGCNAIRTSHNPPAPELLDLCDEKGMLVMDEAFDEWKENHKKFGYGDFFDAWSEADLAGMVRRDRNHPCVVTYSIGNEIQEGREGKPIAGVIARRLVGICHREDPTRPVTSACPSPGNNWKCGLAPALDLFGINYSIDWYEKNDPSRPGAIPESVAPKAFAAPVIAANDEASPPDPGPYEGQLPLIGSETSSQIDTRGEYGLHLDAAGAVTIDPKPNFQLSSYDLTAPGWGYSAETDLLALKKAPWVAGEFLWTGFDYLGEPTPYGWPSRSSYFGIVDTAGFPKDRYFIYQSQWTTQPMVHLLPMSWTWPGLEGKPIEVRVFTNAESVELFLNEQSLGVRTAAEGFALQTILQTKKGEPDHYDHPPGLHLAWSVPYAPGVLKAVARRGGQIVAQDEIQTAGAPTHIKLEADRDHLAGSGQDLAFIKVSVLDAKGTVCPAANTTIRYALSGSALKIVGLDDGDPTNHEPFQGGQHRVFHGLGLVVLRTAYDSAGPVALTASADGLAPATCTLQVAAPTAAAAQ